VKPQTHDIDCPYCNADYRMVECDGTFCFCNSCTKTFIQREVGKKRAERKTDNGGAMMDSD
jgi:transposase-like protein